MAGLSLERVHRANTTWDRVPAGDDEQGWKTKMRWISSILRIQEVIRQMVFEVLRCEKVSESGGYAKKRGCTKVNRKTTCSTPFLCSITTVHFLLWPTCATIIAPLAEVAPEQQAENRRWKLTSLVKPPVLWWTLLLVDLKRIVQCNNLRPECCVSLLCISPLSGACTVLHQTFDFPVVLYLCIKWFYLYLYTILCFSELRPTCFVSMETPRPPSSSPSCFFTFFSFSSLSLSLSSFLFYLRELLANGFVSHS